MLCTEVQENLAEENFTPEVNAHLAVCDGCRKAYSRMGEILDGLASLRKPVIPAGLEFAIVDAVRAENAQARNRLIPVSTSTRDWLKFNIFPYAAGAFASLFVCLLLLYSLNRPFTGHTSAPERSETFFIPGAPIAVDPYALTAEEYAKGRILFAGESPSINPQGSIAALSRSPVRGEIKDDELVVVADVYGNGLAKIATIVERPRNPGTLAAFERAIESGISEAPFVPAEIENRPEIVRVVFRYQQVNVNVGQSDRRRS
jgi:hypothetical protein